MIRFNTGEIVIISFPFSNLAGTVRRPALVLLDSGDDDMVVARVTSQSVRDDFDVEILEWEQAGLLLPSIARVHKLATLDKNLAERRLGILTFGDWMQVRSTFERLCDTL